MIGLHRLQPLGGQQQQQQQLVKVSKRQNQQVEGAGFVRVHANTNMPIIVSSVPKCERNSERSTNNNNNKGRLFQQQQQQQLKSNHPSVDPNRVLLIVNDDHIKGGGVPMIGRRLPTKSASSYNMSGEQEYSTPQSASTLMIGPDPSASILYPLSSSSGISSTQSSPRVGSQQPVVGRRSRRMQTLQEQEQSCLASSLMLQESERNGRMRSQQQELAASSIVGHREPLVVSKGARQKHQHQLQAQSVKQLHYQQHKHNNNKVMQLQLPINEYTLPPMQKHSNTSGAYSSLALIQPAPLTTTTTTTTSGHNFHNNNNNNYIPLQPDVHLLTRHSQKNKQSRTKSSPAKATAPSSGVGHSRLASSSASGAYLLDSSCSSSSDCPCCSSSPVSLQAARSDMQLELQCQQPACCGPIKYNQQAGDSQFAIRSSSCQRHTELSGSGRHQPLASCYNRSFQTSSSTESSNSSSCSSGEQAFFIGGGGQRIVGSQSANCLSKRKGNSDLNLNQQQQQQQHYAQQLQESLKQQQQLLLHEEQSRQARSNHHHSCKANGVTCNKLALTQNQQAKAPVAYRSTSCHDNRHAADSTANRRSHHRDEMLMKGINPLPVHPKPVLSYEILAAAINNDTQAINSSCCYKANTRGSRSRQPEVDEAPSLEVTQMYESLAAELKAKLGDPKMGPILLPPKDYDTMSRKQGKLNGIELRRSTNPQLVGPAAANNHNRLSVTTEGIVNDDHEQHIEHHQQYNRRNVSNPMVHGSSSDVDNLLHSVMSDRQSSSTKSGGSGVGSQSSSSDGSTRSSGRSHSEDRCLQRSGSNSSSGLGSISMSPSSPPNSTSSPTSSKTCSSSNDPSSCSLWNGRVEVPLKINSNKNGQTYIATKQIIY